MESFLAILNYGRERPDTPAGLPDLLAALPQLSRYSAASGLALALDFAVYLMLIAGDMKPVLAGVIGYSAGLALHFLLSIRFVFDAAGSSKAQTRLFGEFALSGLAGIATTAIVITLATDLAGMPGLPAKVLAAATSFVFVYWVRCTMVFGASLRQPPVG